MFLAQVERIAKRIISLFGSKWRGIRVQKEDIMDLARGDRGREWADFADHENGAAAVTRSPIKISARRARVCRPLSAKYERRRKGRSAAVSALRHIS